MTTDSLALAKNIRKSSLDMVYTAKASHIGGALSMADLLAVLYSKILKFNPSNPRWENRDRFLLSKGHACTGLYAVLAHQNFFPIDNLMLYGKDGSDFICHASHKIPGVEFSTGSLGHALPVGCGIALASKLKKNNFNTYVLISDGELDEGSNWESILFAPQHALDNLILIIDYNKIQSLGTIQQVLNLDPLSKKLEAFNWECFEIDGHNHIEIYETFLNLKMNNRPKAIIAHTIKGKGVDFMENTLLWHYKSPSEAEYKEALEQISRT
jgi:transketolase